LTGLEPHSVKWLDHPRSNGLVKFAKPADETAPRKLIFKCGLSPGDILMLTAAVRDLHLSHPDKYITDVNTPSPALWENSPYITHLDPEDPDGESVECEYPLIQSSNHIPAWHDEPNDASIHLLSKNIVDKELHAHQGSVLTRENFSYRHEWLDTRIVSGENVLHAVEELLY